MFTHTQDTYPYSKAILQSDTGLNIDMAESLFDKLPHGSGINYTWHIEQSKRNSKLFYASNHFEAMNENGYYCHVYSFTFTLIYNGKGKSVSCSYCHNEYNDKPGYRSYTDMARYHWSLEDFISKLEGKLSPDGWYTECTACHTTGKINIPEWEVKRLNFHGQKEYSCCGYELRDYLSQLVNECLAHN